MSPASATHDIQSDLRHTLIKLNFKSKLGDPLSYSLSLSSEHSPCAISISLVALLRLLQQDASPNFHTTESRFP
jgi:hypothetical protein